MSTPGSGPKAVFVSHSSKDAAMAQRLCALLEERGVSCWIAPRDITPGHEYGAEIIGAIEGASALLLVMSEQANVSRHVANEVARAFSKEKLIIPVRVSQVQPSKNLELFVSSAHWVQAWQGGLEEKMDEVAAAVRDAMGAAAPAAAAPAGREIAAGVAPALAGPRRFAAALAAVAALAALGAGALLLFRGARPEPRGAAVVAPPGRGATPVSPGPPQAGALVPNYRALVVGINRYAPCGGEGWASLSTARPDAEALASTLEKDYGFSVQRLFDDQATRGAILTALDGLVSLTFGDALLVYFAGHGFYDEAMGEGYWIPADARKASAGRPAKEDWLWNSMISKILAASAARHILVVADSCYGGSLFRGEESRASAPDLGWYKRAIMQPSRYLIASGDLEPVLDSGARHSAFAEQLLAYLGHTDRTVFSASDLAVTLRGRVSELTGQMVRMGPLAVAGHAGGEFVFVKGDAAGKLAAATAPPPAAESPGRGDAAAPSSPAVAGPGRTLLMRDALALGQSGATNAAGRLAAGALKEGVDDRLARAVISYLDRDRRAKERDALGDLIKKLEDRKKAMAAAGDGDWKDSARPRILACIGPGVRLGGPEAENLALLYQIGLRSELQGLGRMQVIEREALEQVLQEMQLGASDVADARARMEIGKLLPAGLLLLGDVLPSADGEKVFLRLVETETTKIVASFSAERKAQDDAAVVCADLAARVAAKAVAARPLEALATRTEGDRLRARVGRFHGADEKTRYVLLERTAVDAGGQDFREKEVGRAVVAQAGELSSDLTPEWNAEVASKPPKSVWAREAAAQ